MRYQQVPDDRLEGFGMWRNSLRVDCGYNHASIGYLGGVAPVASNHPGHFGAHSFGELCRLGFALTWPLAGVVLLALGVLLALLLRH